MGIEALFTSALGLQAPWGVQKVTLDTAVQVGALTLSSPVASIVFPAPIARHLNKA